MADQDLGARLNRLYWESEESVTAIADRLGISRRALYEALEPRPVGAACPECGSPLGFRNRTAAENREAECPECGRELEVEEGAGDEPEEGDSLDSPALEQEEAAAPLSPARRVPPSGDASLLGLVLLAGLVIGGVIVYFLRHR